MEGRVRCKCARKERVPVVVTRLYRIPRSICLVPPHIFGHHPQEHLVVSAVVQNIFSLAARYVNTAARNHTVDTASQRV